MQSIERESLHGVDFQPIFKRVDDAKMLQSSIKSGALQSIDHAIRTLQRDKKLIAGNTELKPLAKTIEKEIKNLQSLRKTIGKAKLETGDQALKLSENVQAHIERAAKKTNDRRVKADYGLEQMVASFDSVITEAGQTLNDVVEREFENIPTKQLTFKEKIDVILKKILNLVVRDPAHTALSQVEKRANNLEKLCKQKDAAIVADLRKGMPIEQANRKAVGRVNNEMDSFKNLLIGSYNGLKAKYLEQRQSAIGQLRENTYETRQLAKAATILARSSAVLENIDGSSIEKQKKALEGLTKETSSHLKNLKKELARETAKVEELEAGYSEQEKTRLLKPMQTLVALLETQQEDLEGMQEALRDADLADRSVIIREAQENVRFLSKQVDHERALLIGDANKRLKDAEMALRALEDCCSDEWPGLAEPNLRNNKSVDAYVKEMKSRVDKGMAFFFNQRV